MSAVTACHSMRLVAESSRVRPSLSPVNWWPDFTAGAAAFIEVRDLGTEDPDDDVGLSIC